MKRVTVLCGCLLMVQVAFSQTWAEWFRQQRTQIQYLLGQIAFLQTYIELGQQGYGIYQGGLGLIGDIKDGEFNLHKDYFNALSSVKPSVKNHSHVREMPEWERQILRLRSRVLKQELQNDRVFVESVLYNMQHLAEENNQQLGLLIGDVHYQLTDEERMMQIEQLHQEMYGYYSFTRWFSEQVTALVVARTREEREVEVLQSLQENK